MARVSEPHRYDRIIRGLIFIPLLPMAPIFLWIWYSTKRRVYQLDDDGTLHMPEGTWTWDEIKDIDMSRWMKKSIAYVEHADGSRVMLDDYKHKNLHLIVGRIASRFYPEQWDEEARMVRKRAEETSDETSGESSAGDLAGNNEGDGPRSSPEPSDAGPAADEAPEPPDRT